MRRLCGERNENFEQIELEKDTSNLEEAIGKMFDDEYVDIVEEYENASMKQDEDTRVSKYQEMGGKLELFFTILFIVLFIIIQLGHQIALNFNIFINYPWLCKINNYIRLSLD